MAVRLCFLSAVILLYPHALSSAAPGAADRWRVGHTEHFDIYFQDRETSQLEPAAAWLEELRSALPVCNLPTQSSPARVVAFGSVDEYRRYRLQPNADAFFLGSDPRDYIVLSGLQKNNFRTAAHEYVHLALRLCGRQYPLWLSEGLAEFYSATIVQQGRLFTGRLIPEHSQLLNHGQMLSLDELAKAKPADLASSRVFATQFYASAWALVRLLMEDPTYQRSQQAVWDEITAGTSMLAALQKQTGRNATQLARDLLNWSQQNGEISGGKVGPSPNLSIENVNDRDGELLLADLLLTAGETTQARLRYEAVAKGAGPCLPCEAALGELSWMRGEAGPAVAHWQRALDLGLKDPDQCYRIAMAADSLPSQTTLIERALRRALELRPNFDDARYRLALVEHSLGNYAETVKLLRGMQVIRSDRGFAYWTALSDALDQAGDHSGAETAANQAVAAATSPDQLAQARRLLLIARTELHVQVIATGDGGTKVITTRVLRGTNDFNPFIEPGDQIRTLEGVLTEVICQNATMTAITVLSPDGPVQLAIEHPDRILLRNTSGQFFCGPQPDHARVKTTYALVAGGKTKLRELNFLHTSDLVP